MSKPLSVVICGTGFGTFYAEATKQKSPQFVLVGIVAKGSERSVKCAANFQVPLYRSPDEVPDNTDIVCVAVRSSSLGGAGTDLSLNFLKRGINVILEQPVHHEDLKLCFKAARKSKCCFMTGNLYLNMPEIRRFLQVCKHMQKNNQKLEYIKAGSSVQAFYPFVEIFQQLVPGGVVKNICIGEQQGSFKQITGEFGEVPFSLQFNNDLNPKDPDNHMQLLHTFCCFFDSGRLELVDTRGPLIWYPRLNMPWSVIGNGGLPEEYPAHMNQRSVLVLTPLEDLDKPYYQFVEESWVDGIGKDLDQMKDIIHDTKKFLVKAQQEQSSSVLWNKLTALFGHAVLNKHLNPEPMDINKFMASSILPEERNQG